MKKLTLKTFTLHDLAKRIRPRMTALEENQVYNRLADLDNFIMTLEDIMMEGEDGDEMSDLMDEFGDACRPLPRKRDKRQR